MDDDLPALHSPAFAPEAALALRTGIRALTAAVVQLLPPPYGPPTGSWASKVGDARVAVSAAPEAQSEKAEPRVLPPSLQVGEPEAQRDRAARSRPPTFHRPSAARSQYRVGS